MTNPFDDPAEDYLMLRNDARQYSLWPGRIPVPDGWQVVYGPACRSTCLDQAAQWAGPTVSHDED